MTVVTKSIVINAPREAIRPYVNEPDRMRSWNPNIYKWEAGEGWPEAGAQGEIGFKASGGVDVEGVMTMVEYDPDTLNRTYTIDSNNENFEPSVWKYTYDENDGQTTVTAEVEYTLPGSYLGKVLDKLVVERGNAKLLEESLQHLKRKVESSS